jgi:hypothetical protein
LNPISENASLSRHICAGTGISAFSAKRVGPANPPEIWRDQFLKEED